MHAKYWKGNGESLEYIITLLLVIVFYDYLTGIWTSCPFIRKMSSRVSILRNQAC